jgi:transcription antitermination factor NusG
MITSDLPFCTPQNLEWFAVHTWSRHEKSVFERLREKQIETFLPQYSSPKRWKNGQVSGPVPLFPGYLFVRINAEKPLPVLQTSGVARFVGFGKKPAAIPDSEIIQLQAAVGNGTQISPHPFLTVGNRVRIKRGPLAGLTGIMTRDKQGIRVVLSVELISRSVSVELDIADLEPVLTA